MAELTCDCSLESREAEFLLAALKRTVWALQDCRDYGECLLKDHLDALEAGEAALRIMGEQPENEITAGGMAFRRRRAESVPKHAVCEKVEGVEVVGE